ncbi:MAG: glucose 1-dehydrogenase [Mycobacterium kyogaense]|uniref:SDR family NAD(P)-dependent oxidoreductase n=1 Tax=Mycobacterium kyogaense TaxID=2212479 RepID=UPI002FF825DA
MTASRPPGRLDGSAAVVTGATSGIGLAIAHRLHAEGARVLATGRDHRRGRELAESLGERVRFVAADLTAPGTADLLTGACVESFGALDVLVNNAGVDHTGDFVASSMDAIRRVFEVNTFATIAMTQSAARRMGDGGAIVNVTSRLAVVGVQTMGIYAASKGAIDALTRAVAVELAPRGIRVNDVAPGMTRTPLYDDWVARSPRAERTEAEVLADIPLRRLATPEDVAAAVAYLASDDARYVTGTTLRVDGGYTAR